jgi:hypothetical protein
MEPWSASTETRFVPTPGLGPPIKTQNPNMHRTDRKGLTDSLKKAGAESLLLNVPCADATNPGKVTQAIQGALSSDSKIDAIFIYSRLAYRNRRGPRG